MYPNLYYVFKDWFGVEWEWAKILNTFGLMVALAFIAAAYILNKELRRKEKEGLLRPKEETIEVGKGAGIGELLFNGFIGFAFGYKLFGLLWSKPADVNPQDYIFSSEGHILGGLLVGLGIAGLRWYEKNKQKLAQPEKRVIRIWPHDRVNDIVIIALIFGILGAKLFDAFEHMEDFLKNPLGYLFSSGGLAFYGGLIVAAAAIAYYCHRKNISIKHLADAVAPGLMIAYAIGRIGCQVAGDGDWGIFNSAYVSDNTGTMQLAEPGQFEKAKKENSLYLLKGMALGQDSVARYVTDRIYPSLEEVPASSFKAPSFLPKWLAAYTYPQNVNNDGIVMPGITDEHNRVLPLPVYPTPLYETIICGIFFLILWALRKKMKLPLMMFGVYLLLNGFERFIIEFIRVNFHYEFLGMQLSQSQFIAIGLMIAGIVTLIYARTGKKALAD